MMLKETDTKNGTERPIPRAMAMDWLLGEADEETSTHDDVVGVVETENQVQLHDGNYYKD